MDSLLRKCRKDGLSSSQGARVIAAAFGVSVTRSAYIGRANRLHLPQIMPAGVSRKPAKNAFGIKPRRKSQMKNEGIAKAIAKSTQPVPPPRDDDIPRKTFDELELDDGLCRHRIDKPFRKKPYGFCGKPALVGLSWCEQHAARAFDNWDEIRPRYRARAKTKREKVEV